MNQAVADRAIGRFLLGSFFFFFSFLFFLLFYLHTSSEMHPTTLGLCRDQMTIKLKAGVEIEERD